MGDAASPVRLGNLAASYVVGQSAKPLTTKATKVHEGNA